MSLHIPWENQQFDGRDLNSSLCLQGVHGLKVQNPPYSCGSARVHGSSTPSTPPSPGSPLKNYGTSDCERGGCDDEARRPSISAAICERGVTKSARPPRHKMNRWNFSTGSWAASSSSSALKRISWMSSADIFRNLTSSRAQPSRARANRKRATMAALDRKIPGRPGIRSAWAAEFRRYLTGVRGSLTAYLTAWTFRIDRVYRGPYGFTA